MMEDAATNNETTSTEIPVSLGTLLRKEREAHGLSVADVAGRTKLAERQIEALEADDYARLPELAFVRGFVRSYAKVLGLDGEKMLHAIPGSKPVATQTMAPPVEVPFPTAASVQQKNLMLLAASLFLAVVVVAFAVWHFTHPAVQPEPVEVLAANSAEAINTPIALPADMQIIEASAVAAASAVMMDMPVSAVAAPAIAAASAVASNTPSATAGASNAPLRLRFTSDESWVEIKDKDGNIIASQVNQPGTELALSGRAPFSLVIAHAVSVQLYYKGKQVDLQPHTTPNGHVARLTLE